MLCKRCVRFLRRAFFVGGVCETCGGHDVPDRPTTGAVEPPQDWFAPVGLVLCRPEDQCTDAENTLVRVMRKMWASTDEYTQCLAVVEGARKTAASDTMPSPPTGMRLGEPKQRLTIHGCRCVSIKALGASAEHPEWGERFLIRFSTASGHDLIWFTGEGGKFDPKEGEEYDIVATIKSHDEYMGHRSTLINRPKVAE